MATEQQNQIMELVVSVNKEKEKRSAALAELIVQHWCGRKQMLQSLLEEGPSKVRYSGASHEKLASLLSRIEKTPSNMLNKRVLTVDEFQKERLIRARINPPPPPLRGIPVPLYPGETQQQYTYKFTRWLAKRSESLEALHNDPKRERKLWLTFAFHRVQTPTTKTENPRDQPSHSRNRTEILAPRVLSVEDYISEMKGPKQNRRKDGKLAKIPVPLFPGETMDDYEQEFGRWLHHRQTSVLSLRYKPLKERVYRHQFAQQRVMKKTRSDRPPPDTCLDFSHLKQKVEHAVQRMNNLEDELPDKVPLPMAKRAMVPTNEDIHRNATRNLARAIQSRIQEDPKKQQLTEAYDYLNKQITMNETAIEDALDYIKAIKSVDGAMAVEQHGQIMELVVSINKEKERRESALAALIFYVFAEKQDTLRSLLNEEILGARWSEASHEKLGTILSHIEEKDSVLETLETHLNEQLQWVTGIPSDVSEVDKTLRFKALRKLSKRLSKEQDAKEQLEREREDVLQCFIQGDKAIRKLIQESLAKNNKASQSV
ncbi:hypothetical protein PHPALM_28449 [Phytophthora palmivora]|uniref:Uncharacterized protein n=1 Tax=Phytophthora palmivora TaxID=4796 RepID=A0A2P4XA21_9STRA|nr:hypothetical protein PHPALM_28449 [Phytophthora palmivora]